jgi:hypothetical protein
MQKLDTQLLANALNVLAETFDRKAVAPKALEMWFDTLREFPTESVLALLHSWPKIHGKMPVPAEVWKVLNERAVEDREQRNRAEKSQRERDYAHLGVTEHGRRCLKLIYDMLLSKPKPTPLEHWRKVMETPGLPEVSYEYARKALAILEPREKDAA